ncbi:hypothetical protein CLAIMM_06704 [Cladophialophora immunda]|nr:hypothetical protein CLAIMM_06704 [Cladophialophora immunda]
MLKVPKRALSKAIEKDARHPDFKLTPQGLHVDKSQVRTVYDKWLDGIFKIIDRSLDQFRKLHPDARPPLLALCGWGSLPPYILQKYKEKFSENNPILIEQQETSLIAQGNFATLTRADLFFKVPARESYGIRYEMLWKDVDAACQENQELEAARTEDGIWLPDRALWVVRKGESLVCPKGLFFVEGRTRVKAEAYGASFPFRWNLDILASGHDEILGTERYGAVSTAIANGRIRVVKALSIEIRQQDCKIKPTPGSQNFTEPCSLEFAFRIRVDCSTICPTMFISIPKERGVFKKRLDEYWREDPKECHTISVPLGLLHAHATLQGNSGVRLDPIESVEEEDEEEEEEADVDMD